MNFRPLQDRVLILPDERDVTSPGGIIVPVDSRPVPDSGTVVAVGAGRFLANGKRIEPQVKPGDHVRFPRVILSAHGTKVKLDGTMHYVIRESEIIYAESR